MYSDKKNILQLVALLEAHGITKVVLCPGSRNAPIVHTLSTHPGFTCYAMTASDISKAPQPPASLPVYLRKHD